MLTSRKPIQEEINQLIDFYMESFQESQPKQRRETIKRILEITKPPTRKLVEKKLCKAKLEVFDRCFIYAQPYDTWQMTSVNEPKATLKVMTVVRDNERGSLEPGEPDDVFVWWLDRTLLWAPGGLFFFRLPPSNKPGSKV